MKTMKKFASLALALVLALALAIPAMATGSNTGTITIKNATIGEDYSIYKIFSATYSGEDNAAYTIKSTDPWYPLVSGEDSPFTLTEIGTSGEYNVAVKEDGNVINWLNSIENLPAVTATQENVTSETVTFTSVSYGYYLIKSSLNGGGILTVDNATPHATVIDKNQLPGTSENDGKKVITIDGTDVTDTTDKSAEIGDTMTFQITYTATNYVHDKQIASYKIVDDMPDGFTLDKNTITVKVGDKTLGENDHSITYDTTDTDDFTIVIPWIDNDKASLYTSPVEIVVTYNATMNSDAVVDGNGNINTATITYNDLDGKPITPPDPDSSTDTKTETVYTYALALKKVNKDGEALAGATFTLKNGDEDVKVSAVSGQEGVYQVNPNGEASIVSPDSGLIVITGLKNATYTLTETAAPAGYNLLTASEEVTPKKVGETTTNTTIWLDKDGNVTAEENEKVTTVEIAYDQVAATAYAIVNFTGAQLPATGGMGTTIFYVVGGVLVLGAAVLLITKKRAGSAN